MAGNFGKQSIIALAMNVRMRGALVRFSVPTDAAEPEAEQTTRGHMGPAKIWILVSQRPLLGSILQTREFTFTECRQIVSLLIMNVQRIHLAKLAERICLAEFGQRQSLIYITALQLIAFCGAKKKLDFEAYILL